MLTLLPSDSLHTYGLLLCSTPTLHVMPERTSGLRGSLGVCVCARTLICVFLTGVVACVYVFDKAGLGFSLYLFPFLLFFFFKHGPSLILELAFCQ